MAMVTDPVADMLARIRNGSLAEHEKVDIPSSKLKVRLAEILKEEGSSRTRLIEDKHQGVLRVYLKYGPGQERVISGLRRVSKPGRRLYVGADRIPTCSGDGRGDPVHPARRAHGPGVPQGQGGRGGPLLRLVARPAGSRATRGRDDVEDRQEADRDPQGCPGGHPGAAGRGQGPEGPPRAPGPRALLGEVADGSVVVARAEHRSAGRSTGSPVRWWRTWCTASPRDSSGSSRSRGSGTASRWPGGTSPSLSATRTRSCTRCPRA